MKPGELFFEREDFAVSTMLYGVDTSRLVIIEPNVKNMAPNKQWGLDRYGAVANALRHKGYLIGQFSSAGSLRLQAHPFRADSFMIAAALLKRARLYIGPEGGMHHAAAAVGTPAVVIFGGYISPAVTGYAAHKNHFTGDGLGCGEIDPCDHCRHCMSKIRIDDVISDALSLLGETDGRRSDTVEALSQA